MFDIGTHFKIIVSIHQLLARLQKLLEENAFDGHRRDAGQVQRFKPVAFGERFSAQEFQQGNEGLQKSVGDREPSTNGKGTKSLPIYGLSSK